MLNAGTAGFVGACSKLLRVLANPEALGAVAVGISMANGK